MRNNFWTLGLALALSFSLSAVPACKKKAEEGKGEAHAEKEGEEHAEGEKEGEEHEEGEEGEKGVIKLTPEKVANARIQVAKVERREQAGQLETTAEIQAPTDGQANVGPRIPGRVTSVSAEVGQSVRRGAVLAVIDAPEVGQAKADYLSAAAKANVAAETAERERKLYDRKITSEREWRDAEAQAAMTRTEKEAAENRLHALGVGDADLRKLRTGSHYNSTVSVPAPISGTVVERNVTLGQMVQPSDVLFKVVDIGRVWILLDIYEKNLTQVKVGQPARVKVDAFPDREFSGRVENVGTVLEARSRSAKARVVLANPEGELRPGMFATVTLEGTSGEARQMLLVPAEAVQKEEDDTLVFVPRGTNEYQTTKIKVGRSFGDWIEVLEGINEGESVVTSGSFFLRSEMKKGELGGHGH